MATFNLPISPVNVQESLIGQNLNSSILLNFLMGIYTMVYAGTMYTYAMKKPSNTGRNIVLSTISLLYISCMGMLIIDWYYLDLAVVIDGDTRVSMFISTVDGGPTSLYSFYIFIYYSLFIVSDGLLIWRCYHVWAMSIRVILLPSILLLAEMGLLVVIVAISALDSAITPVDIAAVESAVITAQAFASVGTTVIATSLIGYKIHYASRPVGALSEGRYTRILTILFESAGAYSTVILISAIIQALPSSNVIGTLSDCAGYYVQTLVTVVAGMAPTILVARISMKRENSTGVQNTYGTSELHSQTQQESNQQESNFGAGPSRVEVNAYTQEDVAAPQDEEKRIQ